MIKNKEWDEKLKKDIHNEVWHCIFEYVGNTKGKVDIEGIWALIEKDRKQQKKK